VRLLDTVVAAQGRLPSEVLGVVELGHMRDRRGIAVQPVRVIRLGAAPVDLEQPPDEAGGCRGVSVGLQEDVERLPEYAPNLATQRRPVS
jgi:hypothetical protein